MPDLLIELLSEEIPARMQARAAEDLQRLVTDGLVEAGLTYAGAARFATPRRLALAVQGLSGESPTRREERRGPRVGAPEAALAGFLRATGVERADLEARPDKKGDVWVASIVTPGRPAAAIVAEVLGSVIREFPWPKSMRWGSGGLRWIRPLQGILCLLSDEAGAEIVPLEIEGFSAGDRTVGHRFMAPQEFAVTSFDDYAAKLRRAKVMLDPADRAGHIRADAENAAFALGLELVEDRNLLAEVAGLVEWPVLLTGEIDAAFLDLPPEVLRTAMRTHQKFFSLREAATGRILRFVTVANRETADAGATILAGNRKVLAARLSDAKFFWEKDLRTPLSEMAQKLDAVTFHNKLGSQAARVARIAALAREIAPQTGADPDQAQRAAQICKADLVSEMVNEFPELQGVMGGYYAEAAGEDTAVAAACAAHYAPAGPGDAVPDAPLEATVALADKLDTLSGFWAIDEKPTGSRDPFGLRRAALGVIRILLSNRYRLNLLPALQSALARQPAGDRELPQRQVGSVSGAASPRSGMQGGEPEAGPETLRDLLGFFHDRLKVHLREDGMRHDVIDACLAMPGADDLTLLVARAEALAAFLKTEDGENLVLGFRRANNILSQAEVADGVEYSFVPDPRLAETAEEKTLFAALDTQEPQIAAAMAAEDFTAAMAAMAALRAPVDAFFEAVQVNCDSQILRRNRLNLLHRIRTACSQVADLSRLEG